MPCVFLFKLLFARDAITMLFICVDYKKFFDDVILDRSLELGRLSIDSLVFPNMQRLQQIKAFSNITVADS